jgi:hypothetical protein
MVWPVSALDEFPRPLRSSVTTRNSFASSGTFLCQNLDEHLSSFQIICCIHGRETLVLRVLYWACTYSQTCGKA